VVIPQKKLELGQLKELDSPTHHHTEKQIANLKNFCSNPPPKEVWKEFLEWSKSGPKVYRDE